MRIGICRLEPQRLGKLLDCLGKLVRLHQDPADFGMRHCLIGLAGQRKPEFLERFRGQSLLVKKGA